MEAIGPSRTQEISPPGTCAHGDHDGVVFSLELVESPALGTLGVPRGLPPPRGSLYMFMVVRPWL